MSVGPSVRPGQRELGLWWCLLAWFVLGGCASERNGDDRARESSLLLVPGHAFEWPWHAEPPPRVAAPRVVPAPAHLLPGASWTPRVTSPFDNLIQEHAARNKLPAPYVRAVIDVESHFDPRATSPCGARGLMQLMPRTARGLGVRDRYDPVQNVAGGTRFLRTLANRFAGDLVLTTAAYNAGGGAVQKYGGVPPFKETQRYVKKVIRRYRAYLQLRSVPSTGEG